MFEKLKLKVPPLIVTFLWGLTMWGISCFFDSLNFYSNFLKFASYVVFVVGVAIIFFGVLKFRKKGTTVDPINPGKTKKLVTNGVYRYSRNPMYLGFFLWLLAVNLYLGNLANYPFLPLFIIYLNLFQIKPEEKILKEYFGGNYERYMKDTRRWI